MENVYAEAMAAVAAIEGILEGHGAMFTKTQTKELLHHLVKAARAAQRHVQRFEEAKQYASRSSYREEYCRYGRDCNAHGGGDIVPCFACGKSVACWKSPEY